MRDLDATQALIRADTERIRGIAWTVENLLRSHRTGTLVEFMPEFVERLRSAANDIDQLVNEMNEVAP